MAHRHRVQKRAGGGSMKGRTNYEAPSNVSREAGATKDSFGRGGHHVGHVHGHKSKGRADKRARGGGVGGGGKSPFSHAAKGNDKHRFPQNKDNHQPMKHGGKAHKHEHGGKADGYARGGHARLHPLNAKHAANYGHHHGSGHEEPLEHHKPVHHAHGGREHHKGMKHGGHAKHHKHGGAEDGDDDEDGGIKAAPTVKAKHVDVYQTDGGTHHWKDIGRARGGRKWIQGAIKHPGALHKQLGVPEGEKIPAKKLAKAAHSDDPTLRRRAGLAKTLKKMHH